LIWLKPKQPNKTDRRNESGRQEGRQATKGPKKLEEKKKAEDQSAFL
jgi:hypothetical protein